MADQQYPAVRELARKLLESSEKSEQFQRIVREALESDKGCLKFIREYRLVDEGQYIAEALQEIFSGTAIHQEGLLLLARQIIDASGRGLFVGRLNEAFMEIAVPENAAMIE